MAAAPAHDADGKKPDVRAARLQRAKEAGAQLAAGFECVDPESSTIFFNDPPVRRTVALIRRIRPTVIVTHSSIDCIADRAETSRIVRQACFNAPRREYEVPDVEPTDAVPHLYYADPTNGRDFLGGTVAPALLVDISSAVDRKQAVLGTFARLSGPETASEKVLERVRHFAAERGRLTNCPAAEGFRQHEGDNCPEGDPLRDALGDRVRVLPSQP